jgi:dihydrofolate reductase
MKKELIIIVGYQTQDRGIGMEGKLPWKSIPTDMKHFEEKTSGHTVIMGRDTYRSIPEKFRPLRKRENIVVTKTQTQQHFPDEVIVAGHLPEAIMKASREKIFLIGGEGIYKEIMERNLANTILATIIHPEKLFACDRFFPELGTNWQAVSTGEKGLDEKSGLLIQFVTFKNKSAPFPLGEV